jgi:hypothetical protein
MQGKLSFRVKETGRENTFMERKTVVGLFGS